MTRCRQESSKPFFVSNRVKLGCILDRTVLSLMFSAMLTDAFKRTDIGIGTRCRFDGFVFNLRRQQANTKFQCDTINFYSLMIAPSTLLPRPICSIALPGSQMPATTSASISAQKDRRDAPASTRQAIR